MTNEQTNILKKKPPRRYRNETIKLRVTKQEKEQILHDMRAAGYGTLTNYVRKMVLNGRIVHVNFAEMKQALNPTGEYAHELNKIGSNINQIAKHMNQVGIGEDNIKYFVDEFSKMKKNYEKAQAILLKEAAKLNKKI